MQHINYENWVNFSSYSFNKKIYVLCKLLKEASFNRLTIKKYRLKNNILRYCFLNDLKITFVDQRTDNKEIFVDYKDLYNKPSQCPIQLHLPKNNDQLNKLIDFLSFASNNKKFKQCSDEYDYDVFIENYDNK